MTKTAALTLIFLLSISSFAQNADWQYWTIKKASWTTTDEQNYSEFITKLGESNCTTVDACLKSRSNHFANDIERQKVKWTGDCGRFPYLLRSYFAWKNSLPFGYASGVASVDGSKDLRYSSKGNKVTGRTSILQKNSDKALNGISEVKNLTDSVYTAMYRFSPETDGADSGLFFDFNPVRISRQQIRPGTIIYDPNGHVAIVYKVEKDGRIRFFDAHPDNTVSRGVYGQKFVRSNPGMGAGFKNFRPVYLANATATSDGRLIGGTIRSYKNSEIPGYSVEQYYGNVVDPKSWKNGKFVIGNNTLDYYDYVRTQMAEGELRYHPITEMINGMEALCQDLKDRVIAVNGAITSGTFKKNQPDRLPENIYGTSGEWEEYSTPSRDARLKTSFVELRTNVELYITMYNAKNPRIEYNGTNLIQDLREAYQTAASKCEISYTRSNGAEQKMSYDDMSERLFAMSFDPYHCIERRWGASDSAELNSCSDGTTKSNWYLAEQGLRNQLERTYDVKMNFNLEQLRAGGPGTGVKQSPDVNVRDFLNRQN